MMTPGTSLFEERALLSGFDGERTVVDPGSSWPERQWNMQGDIVAPAPGGLESSRGSGSSWSRQPEPIWGITDTALARAKEFLALLKRDHTYIALIGAAGFLCFALVCFFATARWRYAVVTHSMHTVAMEQRE